MGDEQTAKEERSRPCKLECLSACRTGQRASHQRSSPTDLENDTVSLCPATIREENQVWRLLAKRQRTRPYRVAKSTLPVQRKEEKRRTIPQGIRTLGFLSMRIADHQSHAVHVTASLCVSTHPTQPNPTFRPPAQATRSVPASVDERLVARD